MKRIKILDKGKKKREFWVQFQIQYFLDSLYWQAQIQFMKILQIMNTFNI